MTLASCCPNASRIPESGAWAKAGARAGPALMARFGGGGGGLRGMQSPRYTRWATGLWGTDRGHVLVKLRTGPRVCPGDDHWGTRLRYPPRAQSRPRHG